MARPQDPERGEAILRAARELLDEVGFAGLTIEEVAERAGVGRPTVYRRWSTKAALAVAAFQSHAASPRGAGVDGAPLAPDRGTLRGDLLVLVERLVDGFGAMAENGVMGGIAAEMATNPGFAEHVRTRWLDPDEAALAVIFARAAARGEVASQDDGTAVLSLLAGMVFYRLVILHQSCPTEWQELVVDLTIHGLSAPRT